MSLGLLLVYVIGFIVIFYLMAVRPQQRQRRAHEALVSSVRPGDQVVTAGGIFGEVKRVDEGIVTVEIARGVQVKMARRAIAERLTGTPPAALDSAAEDSAEDEQG